MIRTSVLANGVQIVTRRLHSRHSASLGLWLANGSRYELDSQRGYAHFLEHLLFKDNDDCDAVTLARRFEAMGGQVNAHTGRELMALHGTVPTDDLLPLLYTFLTMLLRPGFQANDLQVERDVILQEIAMHESDPEEKLEEDSMARAWPGHTMGLSVLGEPGTIEGADLERLRDYWRDVLQGNRVWVIAAGDIDHDALVAACAPLETLPAGQARTDEAPIFQGGRYGEETPLPQSHLLWLMPVAGAASPHYTPLIMANHLLGGGVSSRLFQEVRERLGMTYSIHSRLELYSDCGLWLIQTNCDPEDREACRDAVERIVAALIASGPGDDELDITRRYLQSELLMEDDDPEACMERLAREAIYLGRHPSVAERSAELATITPAVVKDMLANAWRDKLFVESSPRQ